jgi:hypothetical protein
MMAGQYASQTSVSSDSSRNEIERTLRRYGAEDFGYMSQRDKTVIAFTAQGRQVRFILPMPDPQAREFTHTQGRNQVRAPQAREAAYEQAIRQKWRALALMVKAKLEAVESGIVTFEQEFLPHIVMPGGRTVYEQVAQGVEEAYVSGRVGALLQLEP